MKPDVVVSKDGNHNHYIEIYWNLAKPRWFGKMNEIESWYVCQDLSISQLRIWYLI